MKPKDRETIQRALGTIEGLLLSGALAEKITEALYCELNAIDEVMNKEEPT